MKYKILINKEYTLHSKLYFLVKYLKFLQIHSGILNHIESIV